MPVRPAPLTLALAVAMLAAAGCARDAQAPADADAGHHAPAAQADVHAAPDAHAHDDAHAGHAAVDADVPVPEGHEPWTPDAPLIEGMSRIRTAVAGMETAAGPAATAGHLADVDEAIRFIFANCRLEPAPDAALHGVLARLQAASGALHADPADTAALSSMRAAVANYEVLFDDPGS